MAIYTAKVSFSVVMDGMSLFVHEGDTISGSHPIVKGREHLFRPFTPTFEYADDTSDYETAGDAPVKRGPGRPRKLPR